VASCPSKVFAYDERTHSVTVEDALRCTYCMECVAKAETFENIKGRPPLVTINAKQDRFIFTVETTGALAPEEVVQSALTVLKNKLSDIATNLRQEEELMAPVQPME